MHFVGKKRIFAGEEKMHRGIIRPRPARPVAGRSCSTGAASAQERLCLGTPPPGWLRLPPSEPTASELEATLVHGAARAHPPPSRSAGPPSPRPPPIQLAGRSGEHPRRGRAATRPASARGALTSKSPSRLRLDPPPSQEGAVRCRRRRRGPTEQAASGDEEGKWGRSPKRTLSLFHPPVPLSLSLEGRSPPSPSLSPSFSLSLSLSLSISLSLYTYISFFPPLPLPLYLSRGPVPRWGERGGREGRRRGAPRPASGRACRPRRAGRQAQPRRAGPVESLGRCAAGPRGG